MNSFLVFAAIPYGTRGSMGDCEGVFDTLEHAQLHVSMMNCSAWAFPELSIYHILEISDVKLIHRYQDDGTIIVEALQTYLERRNG